MKFLAKLSLCRIFLWPLLPVAAQAVVNCNGTKYELPNYPYYQLQTRNLNGLLVANGSGCDATGKTDSTVCLQALFDAPGQSVEIPAGTFLVGTNTNLILPTNKTIRGQGQGVTTLKVAGGIHVPISSWSVDTSVTPAILTVNLASTPFNGQLYNTNQQNFTSAYSITSSSVTGGVETVAYKLYAGVAPVVGQDAGLVMMNGTSGGGYTIASATGGTTGSFTFATAHSNYATQSENGLGASHADGASYPYKLAALYYTSGSSISGFAENFTFDGGVPNFKITTTENGPSVGPMFASTTSTIPTTASSFKVPVIVPSGAATSGTGGFWVIATPSITAYDHRSGLTAHDYIVRDLTIAGPALPGAGENSYSPYTVELANNDVTPTGYAANAQFLNLSFQNLAGRAAINLNHSSGILAQNLRFLNIAQNDFNGSCASNVVIDGVVSKNTGWSSGTWSDVVFSSAFNMDSSNCTASSLLINNYYFAPAVNGTVVPYAFGLVSQTTPVSSLGYTGATIRNSTMDLTGQTFLQGEFFTGGANSLTLDGNKTIGNPMAVEAAGDNFVAKYNSNLFFVLSFGSGAAVPPRYTGTIIDHNSLVFHSSTQDSGAGISMMNFSGWGVAQGVSSCVWDRISVTNNNLTIVFDATGTPSNFIAKFAEFGSGEGGTGCTFTNARASHNTMIYQGTRPTSSNTDAMFTLNTPVAGSSGLSFDHNIDVGGSTLQHILVAAGSIFAGVTIDGSERSSNAQMVFDNSGGTLAMPVFSPASQSTAPTGSCTQKGAWILSQDGHATFCKAGTWVSKI